MAGARITPCSRSSATSCCAARPRWQLPELGRWVRAAEADALAVKGEVRAGRGGATVALRDLRLLAAGFDSPGANSGDVIGPGPGLEGGRPVFAPPHGRGGLRVAPAPPRP